MKEHIVELFSEFPDSVATVLIAMVPITELRASIPIAITQFEMSPIIAMGYSILGNIIAGALVLFFVENILHLILAKSKTLDNLWQKYINRIHKNNKEKFEKWGAVILVTFVAIPLPLTGIFTGAVAASIFQIPFRQAFPLLALGSVISGIIVTLVTIGATNLI
ncbi:MAG: COG2426 family protein [Candidatus Moraniibacteriota bacterium]|jgi:uncharacterized membrane protein